MKEKKKSALCRIERERGKDRDEARTVRQHTSAEYEEEAAQQQQQQSNKTTCTYYNERMNANHEMGNEQIFAVFCSVFVVFFFSSSFSFAKFLLLWLSSVSECITNQRI